MVNLYDTSKRNTILLGPQGEGLAAYNLRTAGDKAFEFQIDDDGQPFFYPNYSDSISGKEGLVRSSTTIELPDEWHHLAFSWDSDAENGKEGLIYLDGFEVEYDQKFGPDLTGKWINGAITSNGLFYLGRDPKPPYNSKKKEVENRYLLGALDELVIFNDVINSTQLARIRRYCLRI